MSKHKPAAKLHVQPLSARIVGLKELRQNMSKITQEALRKNQRLVVFKKNRPLFELRPLTKKERYEAELLLAVERAEEDYKTGRYYTLEEVANKLGL
ncbi:MAG: hypothetical protein V1895_00370 [Parcubacteria group bacterium]